MSTKDEKDWLRAILEGRVKPGDAEWERIWQDENFTGVRRVLREVGMRKKDELVADREKMWRAIKQYRGEGRYRRGVGVWRWVAGALLRVGGLCAVAFVFGWYFIAKFSGVKGPSCGGSDVGDRSRNTSCRVVYGTGGKDRFVLACW